MDMSHKDHELRDTMNQLESIVDNFTALRHITPVRREGELFLFPIDDSFTLRCSTYRDDVIFEATVAQGSMDGSWLHDMMRINLGRQKENNDLISYDAKEDAIILYMRHPLRELDVHQFAHIFDQMNMSLRFWQSLKESHAA